MFDLITSCRLHWIPLTSIFIHVHGEKEKMQIRDIQYTLYSKYLVTKSSLHLNQVISITDGWMKCQADMVKPIQTQKLYGAGGGCWLNVQDFFFKIYK